MLDAMTASAAELVAAYWQHYRLSTSSIHSDRVQADALDWVTDGVDEIIAVGDESSMDLLIDLADRVSGDAETLAYLGAGPIEDFTRRHGDRGQELLRQARGSHALELAASSAWLQ